MDTADKPADRPADRPGALEAWVRVELVRRIPLFARRVLVVGQASDELGALLRQRGADEIHGVVSSAPAAAQPPASFDSVHQVTLPCADQPFPAGYFGCIVFAATAPYLARFTEVLAGLLPLLSPNGYVLFAMPNQRDRDGTDYGPALDYVKQCVTSAGLGLYGILTALPPEGARVESHYLVSAVRPDYNPLAHALDMFDAGRPEWSLDVLAMLPPQYCADPEVDAGVASDMVLSLLAIDNVRKGDDRLQRFAMGQDLFHRAAYQAPYAHRAYRCHAEFWHRIGDDAMAARLLRSVLSAAPDEATQTQLAKYEVSARHVDDVETTPQYRVDGPAPRRVLFITPPHPHYGLDVLYDGLCMVLGEDNVVDVPRKPTLHGAMRPAYAHYPCTFNRPAHRLTLRETVEALQAGRFDVVLFADLGRTIAQDVVRLLIVAAGDVPVFILDAQDECVDHGHGVMEYLGLPRVAGYFKREMLRTVDYGPEAFPFPFAYPDDRIPAYASTPRPNDVFWAGRSDYGLRRLYLERIEAMLGRKLEGDFPQEEYVKRIELARIGISFFGKGFDTVRYWELPAHGCMLFAETPPIRIPYNFRDGETAVFFDDAAVMTDKLAHYLSHPEEVETIARAGYEHLKRYHTGSARARQFLGWVEQVLERGEG